MYKVFIENKSISFQIKSTISNLFDPNRIWAQIDDFLKRGAEELIVELEKEEDFFKVFEEFKLKEAAGGIVQKQDELLFIFRNGLWDIPKGKLEKGETIEEGAIREIEEECGISGFELEKFLIETWHTFEMRGKKILKRTYWFWFTMQELKMELVPQTEEGITKVAFFHKDKLAEIEENTYQSIRDVIEAWKKNK